MKIMKKSTNIWFRYRSWNYRNCQRKYKKGGVEDDIILEYKNFLDIEMEARQGCLITNPPYGDRLLDEKAVERLYGLLGDVCRMRIPKWSYYIITSYEEFEKCFGGKASKNRKLYNGGIKCYYYQYYGENNGKTTRNNDTLKFSIEVILQSFNR